MANISDKIAQIRSAVYGKDVRESIASGIEAINTESESAKTSAAQSRQAAARAAVDAAHTPRTNAGGHWEVWDATSQAYQDTGIPATGPQGEKGDAGAPGATGPQGEKGDKGDTGPAFGIDETTYNTVAELQAAHPANDGKGHIVSGVIYVWQNDNWGPTEIKLPNLSSVATSGKYSDLTGTPNITALDTAVQSATIGGAAIPKDGTQLQLPAYPTIPDLTAYQKKSENSEAGQKLGSVLGRFAVCLGYQNTCSGESSAICGGTNNVINSDGSDTDDNGYDTLGSGKYNVITGGQNNATNGYNGAINGGASNNILGGMYNAVGGGFHNSSYGFSQTVIGSRNKNPSTTNSPRMNINNDAFIIGNGVNSSSYSNCFRVQFNGNVYGLSSYHTSGADYSEFFEWEDENPNKEDRVGRLAALDGEKIRYAKQGEDILGITSALPAIIGDSPADSWKERYATDVFGRRILEEVTILAQESEKNENGMEIKPAVPEHVETQFKVNPDYDPIKENEYESREKRPEWSTVGMLGKLVLIDDGSSCEVNGYAQPSAAGDGTATKSDAKTNCRVMARLDDTHIKVLLK